MPPLPSTLTGNTFECIFGASQSMLELFILKQKIKGPCWLTVKGAYKAGNVKKTWCKHEIEVDNPKNVAATVNDLNKDSPPLTAVCFSMKTTRSHNNTSEIAMISCVVNNNIN